MSGHAGIWIDHRTAVIVLASEGQVTATTLPSDVAGHPHFGGSQVGGGEKKYEERHRQQLDQFFDRVIAAIQPAGEILIFGPGEAKQQLQKRMAGVSALARATVTVETTDDLTEPQIVARVKRHYGLDQ